MSATTFTALRVNVTAALIACPTVWEGMWRRSISAPRHHWPHQCKLICYCVSQILILPGRSAPFAGENGCVWPLLLQIFVCSILNSPWETPSSTSLSFPLFWRSGHTGVNLRCLQFLPVLNCSRFVAAVFLAVSWRKAHFLIDIHGAQRMHPQVSHTYEAHHEIDTSTWSIHAYLYGANTCVS